MALSRIRGRGQVTIPAEFRKHLRLQDNDPVNLILIGETVIMTPYQAQGERLAKKMERAAKKESISLDDLLKDLKSIRKEHNREKYGL